MIFCGGSPQWVPQGRQLPAARPGMGVKGPAAYRIHPAVTIRLMARAVSIKIKAKARKNDLGSVFSLFFCPTLASFIGTKDKFDAPALGPALFIEVFDTDPLYECHSEVHTTMFSTLLIAFIVLRIVQQLIESALAAINLKYVSNPTHQKEAKDVLSLSSENLAKSLSYAKDRYRFGQFSAWMQLAYTLIFLSLGGLGYIERLAQHWIPGDQPILHGLMVFALVGALSFLAGLPFGYYHTFVIEERHGFNRQSKQGFWLDQLKSIALGVVLGGILLAVLLWIMNRMGSSWWWIAWFAVFGFSLLTAWLYPTLLAPLFNKFSPLDEGDLKTEIFRLAQKIEFQAEGISIMDASTRSSHGNAYFTGVFGKKRIVLFDTLVKSMKLTEIVAVLAHELGHFKLHHVRWGLVRGFFTTGLMFYALSLCLPLLPFYESFGLQSVSNYGALIVFSMWFGLVGFVLQPLSSRISRRHEFQADAFALQNLEDQRALGDALLKLRETSHSMPITHPWYSAFYHSHPPLLERLKAMNYIGGR